MPNRACTNCEELQQQIVEQRETIRVLMDAYREAVGVPPSEHQSRRLEQMAQRLEAAEAELAKRPA